MSEIKFSSSEFAVWCKYRPTCNYKKTIRCDAFARCRHIGLTDERNNADKTRIGYTAYTTQHDGKEKFQMSNFNSCSQEKQMTHDSEYDKLHPRVDILTSGYQIIMPH